MAAWPKRANGRMAAIAALFAAPLLCLPPVPAAAETIPLPNPRPHIQPPADHRHGRRPPARKPARDGARRPAQAAPAPAAQPPNPISNPFAALLGRPGSTTALNPEQRAVIDRVDNYLSNTQILSGNFVQVGPDGGRTQGEFLHPQAGQSALRLRRAEPDRHHRRRPVGGGARPAGWRRRTSIRCRRRRCAFCCPTMST